jgi:hypothetical protein
MICQGPEIGPQFAEVMFDMMAGYSKVKNLCFWGAAIGDGGLLALSDLLQASAPLERGAFPFPSLRDYFRASNPRRCASRFCALLRCSLPGASGSKGPN